MTHVTCFYSVLDQCSCVLEINDLTRFNKIAIQLIQARAQMAADKESTESPHESKCILPLRDIGLKKNYVPKHIKLYY